MTKAKRQEDSSKKDGSASCRFRYEFSSIEAALDEIYESSQKALRYLDEDKVLTDLDRLLFNAADELFTVFFIQRVKDLLYLNCEGFHQNHEYPKTLIADAAAFVLSAPSFHQRAATWVSNNSYTLGEFGADSEKCVSQVREFMADLRQIVLDGLERYSAHHSLFASGSFKVEEAKRIDKELARRHRPSNRSKPGRKPTETRGFVAEHYLAMFYLALKNYEDCPFGKRGKERKKDDFLDDFIPIFSVFAEMRGESFKYDRGTLDEYCLKKQGRFADFVNTYLANNQLSAISALPDSLQRLVRATKKNDFYAPKNWKDILNEIY